MQFLFQSAKQIAAENVSDRAIGYGMPGVTVDGTDPLEVYRVVKEAADRARRGEGPSLVETVCYRLTSHSSDDDQRQYRDAEELENEKETRSEYYVCSLLKRSWRIDG